MISIQFCTRSSTQCNRQEIEIQGICTRNKVGKLSLFADMTIYPENLMEYTHTKKELEELIIELSKGARYKINIPKFTVF